jgi:hypothetical protein
LSCQFIFGRSCFQLLKLKLHLLQQPSLALRAAAVNLTTQLLDLELEVADQRGLSLGARRNRLRFQPCGALGKDHRMCCGKVSRERFGSGHVNDGITSITIRK